MNGNLNDFDLIKHRSNGPFFYYRAWFNVYAEVITAFVVAIARLVAV
jgi:hypothetical protein